MSSVRPPHGTAEASEALADTGTCPASVSELDAQIGNIPEVPLSRLSVPSSPLSPPQNTKTVGCGFPKTQCEVLVDFWFVPPLPRRNTYGVSAECPHRAGL